MPGTKNQKRPPSDGSDGAKAREDAHHLGFAHGGAGSDHRFGRRGSPRGSAVFKWSGRSGRLIFLLVLGVSGKDKQLSFYFCFVEFEKRAKNLQKAFEDHGTGPEVLSVSSTADDAFLATAGTGQVVKAVVGASGSHGVAVAWGCFEVLGALEYDMVCFKLWHIPDLAPSEKSGFGGSERMFL